MTKLSHSSISAHYKAHREHYPEPFRLRIHRALSWLDKAKAAGDDLDVRFLALWIAFNAVYAKEMDRLPSDRKDFRDFLQQVCSLDKEKRLYELIWQQFSGSLRLLLDNRYVFQPFWDYHNDRISEAAWCEDFAKAKAKAHTALAAQDTDTVLAVVFDRLYTLRNQMVHGGATYGSGANRSQLKDGCAFLSACLLQMVWIMLQHPQETLWGKPFYPFVKEV